VELGSFESLVFALLLLVRPDKISKFTVTV